MPDPATTHTLPVATPPAATPPASTPPGATGGDWFSSLTGDDLGYVKTKGYESLAAMTKSHRSLETMLGAPKERILRIPEKADDPAWNDVHARLGRPEKPEGYELPVPEGAPKDFADFAKNIFHKAGLSKAQGQAIATAWNEQAAAVTTAAENAHVVASEAQISSLKKEWGAAYDQNVAIANKVANALGITDKQYTDGERAFGVDGWAKHLHSLTTKFGVKIGEGEFHGTGEGRFQTKMSPDQAKDRRAALSRDVEFMKKFMAGDVDAKKEWDEVGMAIYAGRTDIREDLKERFG